MAHVIKFKMTGMGQIFAHVNRDKNQTRKYGNADIDTRIAKASSRSQSH